MSTALLQVALVPADLLLVVGAWRRPERWPLVLLAYTLLSFIGVVAAVQGWGAGLFAVMQGACWAIFLHLPLGMLVFRRRIPTAMSFLLAAVGIDAFLVEPHWLEESVVKIPGLPMRIALVADLQTDAMGAYEADVFAKMKAAQPDLYLFAGDYLQVPEEHFPEQSRLLQEAIRGLQARYGGIAVKGDVDGPQWAESFAGSTVQAVEQSTEIQVGPMWVTALTPEDSRAPVLGRPTPVRSKEGYHLVLGHAPDIALAHLDVQLILAGHTHGGQVRLLGWPLLTLSKVPRDWAAGVHAMPDGGTLVVSRGIGMERRDAPRLRFNCRPQLVILEPG